MYALAARGTLSPAGGRGQTGPERPSGVRGFVVVDGLRYLPIHALQYVPGIRPTAVQARHGGLPGLDATVVGLGVTLSQELPRKDIHRGDGERLGHRQVTLEVDARARLVPGLAGPPAGPILGGVALLDMTPGDLRLGQSQQLAVQGLELGCLGAAAGDWGARGRLRWELDWSIYSLVRRRVRVHGLRRAPRS